MSTPLVVLQHVTVDDHGRLAVSLAPGGSTCHVSRYACRRAPLSKADIKVHVMPLAQSGNEHRAQSFKTETVIPRIRDQIGRHDARFRVTAADL